MSFFFGNRSNKTFKPKKNIPEGTHQYDLMKHAAATLGSGDLRLAVMLPEGEDLNEWVAVNIVDFFNQINMLYGTITEFCTEESCPLMSAGPKYEYHWADGTTVKKPIKCSAPKYIDYLMTWVQDQLDDESIFPSKIGVPFPKHFISIAKTILKRLFRVYAHIYHQHFAQVVQLDEEAHLNTSFKHFIFFVQEFNLIDKRELAPLSDLIEKLVEKRDVTNSSSNNNNQQNNHTNTHTSSSILMNSGPNSTNNHHHHHHQQQQQYHQHPSTETINSYIGKPPIQPPSDHNGSYYPGGQKPPPPPLPVYQPRILNKPAVAQPYSSNSYNSPLGPPPHYPINNNNNIGANHQGLPPKPTQYYNISGSQQNIPTSTTASTVPPPAYHQHLQQQQQQQQQQQTPYRNISNTGNR